jgi:hypothetical protein
MNAMRGMMGRLKLTVNEAKTRRCRVPDSKAPLVRRGRKDGHVRIIWNFTNLARFHRRKNEAEHRPGPGLSRRPPVHSDKEEFPNGLNA